MSLTSFYLSFAGASGLKVRTGTLAHIGESRPGPLVWWIVAGRERAWIVGPELLTGESLRSLSLLGWGKIATLREEVYLDGFVNLILLLDGGCLERRVATSVSASNSYFSLTDALFLLSVPAFQYGCSRYKTQAYMWFQQLWDTHTYA